MLDGFNILPQNNMQLKSKYEIRGHSQGAAMTLYFVRYTNIGEQTCFSLPLQPVIYLTIQPFNSSTPKQFIRNFKSHWLILAPNSYAKN